MKTNDADHHFLHNSQTMSDYDDDDHYSRSRSSRDRRRSPDDDDDDDDRSYRCKSTTDQ